ncbi:MAG TPA: NF038129 family PEP-CTERM protein [Bryobacteraceae bacterium]|jgi:hypothetical protein|nr:NF038129 family PEP-CTERM protein [Bryobacteraceae bacterium]
MNRIATVTLLVFLGSMTLAAAETFNVTVDTTPVNLASGFLAFDFIGGSPVAGNVVDISNFSSDATLGSATLTGAASGSLINGTGKLDDSQFFNELLQGVTFRKTVSFALSFTTNVAPGGTPDDFAFYLLDATQNPYATTDPSGADSLFAITVSASILSPSVYTSDFATVSITPTSTTTTPEPGTLWLLLPALGALAKRRTGRALGVL